MLLQIVLGDFSGDGHSITETCYVTLTPEADPEVLYENYAKNVELFGFTISDFGEEYAEPTISDEKLKILENHGFKYHADADYETAEGNWLTKEDFISITMFFYLHGLEGYTWQPHQIEAVSLNGFYGRNRNKPGHIGYGLYYP